MQGVNGTASSRLPIAAPVMPLLGDLLDIPARGASWCAIFSGNLPLLFGSGITIGLLKTVTAYAQLASQLSVS
ncbi:hypothetical protein OK016_04235 [Vibrio chagasii]|nr:hypothetical protein [Vibrio chagasii]